MSGMDEYPRSYGSYDIIWVKNLPLTINLTHRPEKNVLFFGPGLLIPLAVIPWPPGIIRRLRSKSFDDSADNVEVILTFERLWGYWDKSSIREAGDYQFEAKDAVLQVGSEEIIPSSFTYSARQLKKIHIDTKGAYTFGGELPDPYAGKYDEHNGVFDIHVSSDYDRRTEIRLVFDLKYRDLKDAVFKIKHLKTPTEEKDVPPTLLSNRRKLKLRWYYTINT